MFENLGRVLVNYRKAAVALFVIGILVAGAVGSLIFSRLDSGGYSDPNSDSYKVYEYLRDDLKVEDPAVVVVIDAGDRDVTEPAVAQQALALEAMMAQCPDYELVRLGNQSRNANYPAAYTTKVLVELSLKACCN